MRLSLIMLLLTMSLSVVFSTTAVATEPAVAGINGKTSAGFGTIDGDSIYLIDGSATFPIAGPVGLQLDLGFGQWDADLPDDVDITRLGLHLFTRNPELGSAGLYLSTNELESGNNDFDIEQYAAEAEFYTRFKEQDLSIAALVGQINPERGDNDVISSLDIRWYPYPELMVELGAAFVDNDHKTHIGAEYQILPDIGSFMALAAYADFAVGEDSYDHALLGVRAYFGQPKPLVKRHRQDCLGNSSDRLNPPLLL